MLRFFECLLLNPNIQRCKIKKKRIVQVSEITCKGKTSVFRQSVHSNNFGEIADFVESLATKLARDNSFNWVIYALRYALHSPFNPHFSSTFFSLACSGSRRREARPRGVSRDFSRSAAIPSESKRIMDYYYPYIRPN